MLNIKRVFDSHIVRLSYIVRCSGAPVNHAESVAEHTFWVAFFTMLIATDLKTMFDLTDNAEIAKPLDWQALFSKAIMHDVEEGITGDFPRPFKYSSDELRKALDVASSHAAMLMCNEMAPNNADLRVQLYLSWSEAKDDTLEGRIVEIADCLSVVMYVHTEQSSGNTGILKHMNKLRSYVSLLVSKNKGTILADYVHQLEVEIDEMGVL